ncbi:Tannase domain containing protein [Pyrenophora tritici-repentis]|uniref:Carboxylic ester hydrolase n=2 Tax=Pyrenophora tritici-repentis TaxID=45151 RepID=A0A2W1EC69_9PLEO|nr:feruloyl esterase B precursor [Pyrenophora tritici-repentis Pt-1C-BFP]KAA8612580.1 Tannase domain-containing protein [Pyrenophora tritici-repentis]EDU47564.1 feruloyl esterase B precursor [Pyrenophora tritici-repentis Pt-1C-BFP]KAF7446884.1 Tannase domain containing protein [Pyrenophora tritici-repentis]KAF7569168.1 Tannase domain containing protein [Pyrenophora tritici-repentis]KAG9383041.1 Tannase domain containing protein [Pyrenophora tritici-repentis]
MRLRQSLQTALLCASSALAAPHGPSCSAPIGFSKKCADFASDLVIEGGVVNGSSFVPAGTNFSVPIYDPTCNTGPPQSVPITRDMCRIVLEVSTSARSGFKMEAWLPTNWTGRFLSVGNGGLNGCISFDDMGYTAGLGFASVGTNNGHDGGGGLPFYNNADVVEDFAYRALHTGVVVGKQITQDFYGKPHDKSFYLGCSTGGRQGFKSAQDFPDDFDGIIAGAPAVAFNNLTSWSGHFYPITGPSNSSTFIPLPLWSVIHDDVMKQCDGLDGLVDGILEDPLMCHYDPSGLVCAEGSNSSACLTPTQVQTVKKFFAPLVNDQGDLVYPPIQYGVETEVAAFLANGQPFPYTTDWFRYAIYNDPNWDPATLGPKDYDYAAKLDPFGIQSWKGDLSAVRDRGAKVLHWHGLADAIISSDNSPRYYNHVRSTMNATSDELDKFYRFFRVSGTGHCRGGNGAHAIGQGGGEINGYEPSNNILMALVDWVEKGNAPDYIMGTKFVNDTESLGIELQRAHCRFPRRNQYKGEGDPNLPESWECVNTDEAVSWEVAQQ